MLNTYKNLIVLLTILIGACTLPEKEIAGATDIETGGTIAGVLYTPEGEPEANATVSLLPTGYSPLSDTALINKRHTVTTNSLGQYSIDSIKPGTYALETVDSVRAIGLYKRAIVFTDNDEQSFNDTLKGTGKVILSIPLPTAHEYNTLFIENTTFTSPITIQDSMATVTFNSLPPSVYPSLYYRNTLSGSSIKIDIDSIEITSGDTLHVNLTGEPLNDTLSTNSSSSSIPVIESSSLMVSSEVLVSSEPSLSSSSSLPLSSSTLPLVYIDSSEVLNIDGSPEHIAIQSAMNYDWPTHGITMELWVFWDHVEQYSHMFNISRGHSDNYLIVLGGEPGDNTSHTLKYTVNNAENSNNLIGWYEQRLDDAFNTGEWNHLAATVTPTGVLSLYVNGELRAEYPAAPNALPTQINRSSNLIGQSLHAGDGNFDGMMDNVRLWNRALTIEEINANIYHTTAQLTDTTRLIFSYDFEYDPVQPSMVIDATGKHHGDISTMDATYAEFGTWRPQVDFSGL